MGLPDEYSVIASRNRLSYIWNRKEIGMRRSRRDGFTLVEVLVVIAIIALLTGLILGLAGNAQKSAARNRAEAEISDLENFITDYQMEYGQVPIDRDALQAALISDHHSLTNLLDPWGAGYNYVKSSQVTYYLWSEGGSTNGNRQQFIGNPQ